MGLENETVVEPIEQEEIESALADNDLYQAENKGKLNKLLDQQAKCIPELNNIEEQLLEQLELLEEKESTFNDFT